MSSGETTTPFAPLDGSGPAALAPIAAAVVIGCAPVCANVVRHGILAAFHGRAAAPVVWAVGLAASSLVALAVTSAVARRYGRACAALLASTLTLSLALAAGGEVDDVVLVGLGCAIPVALLTVLATAPLFLAARLGAREPDAREHYATSSAVWLLVMSALLEPPFRQLVMTAAALLAVLSFQRDLWRATWLRRVRAGAVAGVRLARPWPTATERLEVVVETGDGPFRRAARTAHSDVVRIAWARVAASLGVVALCAAYASGLF